MVKRIVDSPGASDTWVPVAIDEIAPEVTEEVAATLDRLKRGESKTTSHEQFMRELGFEDLLDQE